MVVRICFAASLLATSMVVMSPVGEAWGAVEVEDNGTFAGRQMLAPGTTTVTGNLYNVGEVDTFTIAGLVAGAPYVAWTDNTLGAGTPDTLLGAFDGPGSTMPVVVDDDSSPVGNGFASALNYVVNADGSIRLAVTGWPDFDFMGAHTQNGDYGLFVNVGQAGGDPPEITPGQSDFSFEGSLNLLPGDIDYFSFTGLMPGSMFTAEVTMGSIDSLLGWFADDGTLLAEDDDGGTGFLSRLSGTVPGSGIVNLAVSGFPDFNFTNDHTEFGDYTLVLSQNVVPEPSALAIWLLLGLTGLAVRFLPGASRWGSAASAWRYRGANPEA